MSSRKNTFNKTILKNYFEELNLQRHLKILSTDLNHATKNKKIYLNCLTKENINPKQNNINTMKNKEIKKKSFSLYKSSANKNPTNLYKKYASLSKNKKKRKIVLNCDESNNQKNKVKFNLFKDYKISKKILSNGSTRKSSDASPNEQNEGNHQTDIANFKKNYKYCSPTLKPIQPNKGRISLKNQIDNKRYTSLKKNILDLNNSHSKSKEKEDINKNRNSVPTTIPIASSAKQNCFLNYNKISSNISEKKDSVHNSVCHNPVPPLKLFDCNISSSSDSEEEEEEGEDEKESDEAKYENLGDQKMENELIMDSTFKISDDELSNELNDCDAEKRNLKIGLIEKKLLSNSKNQFDENVINKENKIPPNKNEKFGISCKNMTTKLYLNLNKNQMSNSNKNKIISSVVTTPGISDEKEKTNQDSYLINKNIFKENYNIYGVFDGHGENGHLISQYISEYMKDFFTDKLNYLLTEEDKQNLFTYNIIDIFLKNYEKILKSISSKIDQALNTSINFDISQSGSTSVMLFILNNILICSNIGDSQCYLFNCSSEDLWTFEALSHQHLASDENEQKRILESGGEVHPYYEEDGVFEGPDRVYAKNKVYPGLVMSRTFGDLEAKKIGVISEPDIIMKKIDKNSKFIVLASDGLWDVLKPYDVNRIVRPFFNKDDIEGACQALMKRAIQQWIKDKEERDDITIIVVFIGTPNHCLISEKHNSLKKIDEIINDGK